MNEIPTKGSFSFLKKKTTRSFDLSFRIRFGGSVVVCFFCCCCVLCFAFLFFLLVGSREPGAHEEFVPAFLNAAVRPAMTCVPTTNDGIENSIRLRP